MKAHQLKVGDLLQWDKRGCYNKAKLVVKIEDNDVICEDNNWIAKIKRKLNLKNNVLRFSTKSRRFTFEVLNREDK